jgi:hypothetical protein
MRDNYDFSDAVKNPFAGKEKGKFNVTIYYDYDEDSDDENTDEQSMIAEPSISYNVAQKGDKK